MVLAWAFSVSQRGSRARASVLTRRLWNAARVLANRGVKLSDSISSPDTARPAGPSALCLRFTLKTADWAERSVLRGVGAHPVSGAHRTQGCESPRGKTPAPQPLDARRTSAPPGVSSSLARQPPRCEPAPQVEPCVQSRARRAGTRCPGRGPSYSQFWPLLFAHWFWSLLRFGLVFGPCGHAELSSWPSASAHGPARVSPQNSLRRTKVGDRVSHFICLKMCGFCSQVFLQRIPGAPAACSLRRAVPFRHPRPAVASSAVPGAWVPVRGAWSPFLLLSRSIFLVWLP